MEITGHLLDATRVYLSTGNYAIAGDLYDDTQYRWPDGERIMERVTGECGNLIRTICGTYLVRNWKRDAVADSIREALS